MVKRYMDRSGMKGMYETRYTSMNKGVTNAFIKKWHNETSFFHLPIGEMTIIVDDVSHLLHLLITGRFLDHMNSTYTRKEIKGILRLELGIMTDQEVDVTMSSGNTMALALLEKLYRTMLLMSCSSRLPRHICYICSAIPYFSRKAQCLYTSVTCSTLVVWITTLGGATLLVNCHMLASITTSRWEVIWVYSW